MPRTQSEKCLKSVEDQFLPGITAFARCIAGACSRCRATRKAEYDNGCGAVPRARRLLQRRRTPIPFGPQLPLCVAGQLPRSQQQAIHRIRGHDLRRASPGACDMHGIHHPGQARDSCDGVPDACQRASLRGTQPGALRGTVDVHLPLQHRHQAIGPGQYVLDALGDFDRQLPDRFADQLIQVRVMGAV
ncbi:hypothetical protein G6F57_013254 [Rhizopus arrhizus]|nr:hypothetical protein G6F57_013254 [Rhizopus arrhizus]